jgi:hypothetical protein
MRINRQIHIVRLGNKITYSVKQKWRAEYCKIISEVRDMLQSIAALSQARKTLVE